ncbi:Integrase catalytic domain-containing protein [Aphis craccivora]|uniref:Integrase catalytic domain-containing protein n=1 Tax=Aphis craccivora TaxID=307492 RepID=A0A6G0Y241_APHCR|nr:Integrase catalytic domain-containing protein [Aphis craccivora]
MLDKILSGVPGVKLYKFSENESVIQPEKSLPNLVFLFDNVITNNHNIVRSYFTRSRHHLIDVCYLAQSYSRVPKQLIRNNANYIVLFKQDEINLKHVYDEHYSGDIKYSEFKDFCMTCWRGGRFEFVVISSENARDNSRYRHGFDMFETDALINNTFGSIIEPLNEIRSNNKRKPFQAASSPPASLPSRAASPFPDADSIVNRSPPQQTSRITYVDLNACFGHWTKPVLYRIYGPRKSSNDAFELGGKEIQFFDNRAIAKELHASARRIYLRRRVIVYGKNDLFQANLVDMQQYSAVNKSYNYILFVIDCFTKRLFYAALKTKRGEEVTAAAVKKHNIKMYSTFSVLKTSIIERVNRTIKARMFKEFTSRGSHVWIAILPALVDGYNNSMHRTIGMTPMQADAHPSGLRRRSIFGNRKDFKIVTFRMHLRERRRKTEYHRSLPSRCRNYRDGSRFGLSVTRPTTRTVS